MSMPVNLPMVDLKGQYEKIKQEIDSTIQGVIDETAFIKGEEVNLFERELAAYLGVKHVVGCANGTDALQLALMALDLKPGDEVITPDFTFIATVEVVALLGLNPILVDVNPDDFTINIDELKKAITPKTKAIIPVHLFGQCANMEAILEVAQAHQLAVVEDVAQAIGSTYYFTNGQSAKAGAIGHIGCTSFFPSKNLGCYGDGGALFTNDDDLAREIRSIANHGMTVRYHHDRIGVNSRLDTIQAAILRVKLQYLEGYNLARQEAAMTYDAAFREHKNLIIPHRVNWSDHVFHQYTLRIVDADRNDVIEGLKKQGIPAMVYYPIPLHKQKAFNPYLETMRNSNFPNSLMLSQSVISLPMHTELTPEIQQFIADNLLALL